MSLTTAKTNQPTKKKPKHTKHGKSTYVFVSTQRAVTRPPKKPCEKSRFKHKRYKHAQDYPTQHPFMQV